MFVLPSEAGESSSSESFQDLPKVVSSLNGSNSVLVEIL